MSQRESGYQRKLLDQYETPAWVTRAMIPHLPEFTGKVWEPACGGGRWSRRYSKLVSTSSGATSLRVWTFWVRHRRRVSAIITNPPYALAREFIERALHFYDTRIVAMLLRTDFDHAASRAHLFADCAMFAKKVVLTNAFDGLRVPSDRHRSITAG